MENPIQYLETADPELAQKIRNELKQKAVKATAHELRLLAEDAVWALSEEISFGYAVAMGYVKLLGEVSSDWILRYHELITAAGQKGPTMGRMMAIHSAPVLKCRDDTLFNQFLKAIDIMIQKGTYTLNSPFETLSALLHAGDQESAQAFLQLLCDTYIQDMSYNQSLNLTHTIPKAVMNFSPSKRSWQVEQLRRVIRTDLSLADRLLTGLEHGLNLLSQEALAQFVSIGLEKYTHQPESGSKFLSLESKAALDKCADMQVTVPLAQVRQRLNAYIQARTGIRLEIRGQRTENNEQTMVFSDGKTIYLPDEISLYSTKKENLQLYKCLTGIEAAYYEFETFGFDLEKMEKKAGGNKPKAENKIGFSELERFFQLFDSPGLASDLFSVFEHGRLRKCLMRKYPGMMQQAYPLLRQEFLRICENETMPEVLARLYARIALDMKPTPSFFPTEFQKLADRFESKIQTDDSVQASAELVCIAYPAVKSLLPAVSCLLPSLKTPFGWKFRPDLFYSVYRQIEHTAESITDKLRQHHLTVYKSDIRKQLIKNNGSISEDHIRKLIESSDADQGEIGDLSWLNLPELLGMADFNSADTLDPSWPVAWYKEWDNRLGDYLNRHVRIVIRTLTGKPDAFYQDTLERNIGLVRRIRHAFELLKPQGLLRLRKWIEGEEFDYRAITDYAIDQKAGITPSERLYIKRIKQQRDVAVLLLTDLSRSTANPVQPPPSSASPASAAPSSTVLDIEKEAIVLFCEAIAVVGDAFAIAGFSGTGRLSADYFRIKDFDEPMNDRVRERINALSPQRSTRMGAAIRHAVSQLENTPAKVRILIVLTDGFPNDSDYKQDYAIEDTRRAILEARAKNIHTKAIIVNLAPNPKLDELYGSAHHYVISDVRELPDRLLRIYGTLTR